AKVAGVVPAVLVEDSASRFLVLPVALEHVRTMCEDLAVLGEFDLDSGQRRADRAQAVELDAIEREAGGALGRSVPLDDVDAQLAPRFAERRVEGGAAGHDVAE